MSEYGYKKLPEDNDVLMKQAVKESKDAWQKKMKSVWERRKIIYKNYWIKKLRLKAEKVT